MSAPADPRDTARGRAEEIKNCMTVFGNYLNNQIHRDTAWEKQKADAVRTEELIADLRKDLSEQAHEKTELVAALNVTIERLRTQVLAANRAVDACQARNTWQTARIKALEEELQQSGVRNEEYERMKRRDEAIRSMFDIPAPIDVDEGPYSPLTDAAHVIVQMPCADDA